MHSLLSYRFEQLLHDNSLSNKSRCRLLAIHLYVDDLEKEENFYSQLLSCSPQVEDQGAISFVLADGIHLVLEDLNSERMNSKKNLHFHSGQIELELETPELAAIRKYLASTVQKGMDWLSTESKHVVKILSPGGLLLSFRQKLLQ